MPRPARRGRLTTRRSAANALIECGRAAAATWDSAFVSSNLCQALSGHGLMSKVETAQLHPLFYPWHAFVDEIFATWEGITKFRTPYQPPDSWPWDKMLRRVNSAGTPANAPRAKVPFLLGLNRDRAKRVADQA